MELFSRIWWPQRCLWPVNHGDGVEGESSCAVVIKELVPINGDNIKIPVKNTGRIIFLIIFMSFDNATNT